MRRGRRPGAPRTARAVVVDEAMRACDVGITDLAARLGVARSTVRRWLDGDSRATSAFSLDALWDALGVTGERRERLSVRLASAQPPRSAAHAEERGGASTPAPEQPRAELVALLQAELSG